MTLAHIGLGVFIIGVSIETNWRVEAVQAMAQGSTLAVGAYQLKLDSVGDAEGPNYVAERAAVTVTRGGHFVCTAAPERRFYPQGDQTVAKVAMCMRGASDVYVVLGERRAGPGGAPVWLVRSFFNPWVRFIFLGPLLMALGGAVSLSDRRLRLGVPRRAAEPALEPAR
jgi:cytochrome c-type biogenesis protein CcmF